MRNAEKDHNDENIEGSKGLNGWEKLKELVFKPKKQAESGAEEDSESIEGALFGEDPYETMHERNAYDRLAHQESINRTSESKKQFAIDVDDARRMAHKDIRVQRVQEMIERDLNSRLMTADEMYESEGAEKRTVLYGDKEVTVIDMSGAPYRMLVTAIDYKTLDHQIGYGVAKRLMADPSLWDENREIAEKERNFGGGYVDSRADTICTSYINSEANASSSVPGKVVYGFDHIKPDSVVIASATDAGSTQSAGSHKPSIRLHQANFVSNLEKGNTRGGYNEITLRRYDESGEPLRPSYIVAQDGDISEDALRHASFWGIPIINIKTRAYREKAREKGKTIIESIDDNIGYIELEKKLGELSSYSEFSGYNDGYDRVGLCSLDRISGGMGEDERRLMTIELSKTIEYLKELLEDMTQKINSDTEKGVVTSCSASDYGLTGLSVELYDEHGNCHSERGIFKKYAGADFRRLEVDMRHKELPLRGRSLLIYDGERPQSNDVVPDPSADSSIYDELEPIVIKYFDACRRNDELKNKLAA